MQRFTKLLAIVIAVIAIGWGGYYLLNRGSAGAENGQVLSGFQVDPYSEPAQIKIPAIDVDAKVLPMGVDAEGRMESPKNQYDVSWYKEGVFPGAPGSAVFAGHLTTKLDPSAVFYDLKDLKEGDEIVIVDKSGEEIKFRVSEKTEYAYNEIVPEIFERTGNSRINLITCAGEWNAAKKTYEKRLVVTAQKI